MYCLQQYQVCCKLVSVIDGNIDTTVYRMPVLYSRLDFIVNKIYTVYSDIKFAVKQSLLFTETSILL